MEEIAQKKVQTEGGEKMRNEKVRSKKRTNIHQGSRSKTDRELKCTLKLCP